MPVFRKNNPKSIINKAASNRVLKQNSDAFKAYDYYKKTADIIDRVEFASGRRVSYKTDNSSALDFKININGTYSTTAQTI